MRHRRTIAVVVLLKLAVLVLCSPLLAQAATPTSPAGTYEGVAQGSAGAEADSSAITVYVEDLGTTLRFTATVHRAGATISTQGTKQPGNGTGTMQLAVDSFGIRGTGFVSLAPQGETWVMSGEVSGSGFGKEGSATFQATQVSGGLSRPGLGAQLSDMVSSLFGGPSEATQTSDAAGGEAAGASGPDSQGSSSWLAPAQAGPPLTVGQQASSAGLGLLALIVAVFLV